MVRNLKYSIYVFLQSAFMFSWYVSNDYSILRQREPWWYIWAGLTLFSIKILFIQNDIHIPNLICKSGALNLPGIVPPAVWQLFLNLMPAYCPQPLPRRAFFRNISGAWHVKRVQWPKAVFMMLILLVFSEVNVHVSLGRSDQSYRNFPD